MCFGGIGVVRELVNRIGLVREINDRLDLFKRHLPYRESDHVVNVACNILCGGGRLEDLNRLRNDVPYMDALGAEMIPSPTAAGDFMRRFTEKHVLALMEAFNAVRPRLWRGRGRALLAPVAYVDIDGTVAPTQGEKKTGMDLSYKGIWGYQPLIISLANTGEVLYIVNRPGNLPSHTGAAEWIDRAVDLVEPHVDRVCLRGDTHFALSSQFDKWSRKVDFIFGIRSCKTLAAAVEVLEDDAWQILERKPRWTSKSGKRRAKRANEKERIVVERGYDNLRLNHEDVAEFTYRPPSCKRAYRLVVVRKNISRMKGELTLFDELRYFYYITTREDLSAAEVVRKANQRCDQENLIAQLKSGVDAMRVPLYDLESNWAYMVIATLAWNLKSWFAMFAHLIKDRRRLVAMEFRRFIREMIIVACHVIRRSRRTTLRIIGWQPSIDRLFSIWGAIGRAGFT